MVLLARILMPENLRRRRSRILRAPQLPCSRFTSRIKFSTEKEADERSGRGGDFYPLAPGGRIPDSDRKSCNRSSEQFQILCKVPPSAPRRATNCSLSSITEHSFQGITPSPKGEKA